MSPRRPHNDTHTDHRQLLDRVSVERAISYEVLADRVRVLIRIEGMDPQDSGGLASALMARLADDERDDALLVGLDRLVRDVLRSERNLVISRLERIEPGISDEHYLTLDMGMSLLDLCESYVVVDGQRRRAGSCRSADLRLVAADYRRRAAQAVRRADWFEQLAASMDATSATTLDDYARGAFE